MPLNWGCSLQPIHGSCGIRLLQQFWPALPKLFGSSAVSPLTLSLNSIRPVIQTWFAEWTFQEPPIFTFGIVWRITNYRSIQTPSLCTFSQLHPSFPLSYFPSVLHPSPAYPTPSPSFSLSLLPFLCLAVPGLIYLSQNRRARGKAPGYICQLLRLDLLHGRWLRLSVWVYLLTPAPPASSASLCGGLISLLPG